MIFMDNHLEHSRSHPGTLTGYFVTAERAIATYVATYCPAACALSWTTHWFASGNICSMLLQVLASEIGDNQTY
jgi:hypothetical protein